MSMSKGKAESVLTDLNIVEDVLSALEDKVDDRGQLFPRDIEKLDKVEDDVERARLLAIEAGDSYVEAPIARAQSNIEFILSDDRRSASREKVKQNLKWGKERIVEAQEAI